ncbi:MAG: trypsin-like peptidase domain-containing protein [Phycisphaerales bacterium]|nr:trypsin-like peptidase domain-containing protein [Phycisphaerales bacterium]MCB9856878.1 trypsin-like peptidase domain-containing protein [Phycisphaerales bacterium]MCB9861995.1 trypsin-like peptidase domain-containing protein [Phycisphaerales bacterium]
MRSSTYSRIQRSSRRTAGVHALIVTAVSLAMTQTVNAQSTPMQPVGSDPAPTSNRAERMTPIVRVFQQASPAVVNLSTSRIVTVQRPRGFGSLFDDIFDVPSGPRQYKTQSVGSGFVIHKDGYIVTNAHVVERAAEIKATFADGTELDAREVAVDRQHDLAVLKVEARGPLPYLKMGRSDDLMQGETVIVIGNPLGYAHTITTGVVSALNRELVFDSDHVYSELIQTDASINPGNSGGPLLNILGELIGINSAIRGDAQNIGFAIPVNQLHKLLPEMLDIERLRRVSFGVHFEGDVSARPEGGVRVKSVDPDTPAAAVGVRPGDVVTAIDNLPTPNFMEAFSLLARTPTGQSLKLDLRRTGQSRASVEVPLADRPTANASEMMERFFGVGVREMTRRDQDRYGLRRSIGLVIESVAAGSEAEREGLNPGDMITQFGGWAVTDLAELAHLVNQVSSGDLIPIQLLRPHRGGLIRIELGLRAR